MKRKILIILIVLIILVGLFISGYIRRPGEKPGESPPIVNYYSSALGPGPRGLAITPDGKKAYVSFNQEDKLLVVDLSTLSVIDSIDVSAAGTILVSSSVVLTPDGKKLYVANDGTKNIMVVNTESKRVEKVLPINTWVSTAIAVSRDGSKAYVPSSGGSMLIINVADDSYQSFSVPDVGFKAVAVSPRNPDILYIVGTRMTAPEIFTLFFFVLDVSSQTIIHSLNLPEQTSIHSAFRVDRIVVNSDETRAYFGSFQFGPEDKGVGNFTVLNLSSFQVVASVPMKYGVSDFAVNENTGKVYISGLSESEADGLSVSEYDLLTNGVAREIPVSPSSDQRAIVIDPKNPNYLYMTEGDYNLLRKVDITTGKEIGRLQFHISDLGPYAIVRDDNDIGYIFSMHSQKIYKLDLRLGQLIGTIPLPSGGSFIGGYHQGKLYFSGGRYIYSINPSDGALIETFDIGMEINPKFFTFFDDKMATINSDADAVGGQLLLFNATTMDIIKSVKLPHEPHGDKVIVSPDGSKLYVERGPMGVAVDGITVITIYNATTLQAINTIEIPPHPPARGMAPFIEAYFDKSNRVLYLLGHASVYKIDMDTNKLIGIIDVIDAYESQNINGWPSSSLSGIAPSPAKDKLFIVSSDAHSVFTYDLTQSAWETKITNLQGYFNTDSISSSDWRYLYTVNSQSDSITMVDLTSGEIVRIIRLKK